MICAEIYFEFDAGNITADEVLEHLAKMIGAAAPGIPFAIVKTGAEEERVYGMLLIDHPMSTIRAVLYDVTHSHSEDLFFEPTCEWIRAIWGKPIKYYN